MYGALFAMWMLLLMLLVICCLAYGLLIPWLGFYWDDWPNVWVSYLLGPAGLMDFHSLDRPVQGWLHVMTTAVVGKAPLDWHIVALLARWLGAVAVWWSLRGVWPRRTQAVACVALLFAVYPGFTLQPMPFMSAHAVLIPLALSIFSLGAMVWALRVPRLFWILTSLALFSSAFCLWITEYYAGLEFLRPVFLWLVLAESTPIVRQRLRRTLKSWSPYLALMGIYLVWRLFFFKSLRDDADQSIFFAAFAANPLSELTTRLRYVFTDVIESSIFAWGQTFRAEDIFDFVSRSAWIAWGLVFVGAGAVILYLMRRETEAEPDGSTAMEARVRWAKQAIIIGLFAILVGGLPVWFVNRQISLAGLGDRYTLPAMLGACLLMAGLIHTLIRTRLQQFMIIGVMVGLAVGFHFRNANRFRQDWSNQKSLYWQLSWRAPGLKPGTSVVIDKRPVSVPGGYGPIADDYALSAALNFVYAPQHRSAQLDYWFVNLSQQSGVKVPRLVDGVRLEGGLRSISFSGSTSDSLVVWFSPPSCLRVLDPSREELPQLPPLARAALPISHVDRIVASPKFPARPPAEIFGREPDRDWCYYFQKADLARQTGDWQRVAQLGDEARRMGFKPSDSTEWLPFVEGYAHVGRYDDAREMTGLALQVPSTPLPVVPSFDGGVLSRGPAYQGMSNAGPALSNLLRGLENVGPQDPAHKSFVAEVKARLSSPIQ